MPGGLGFPGAASSAPAPLPPSTLVIVLNASFALASVALSTTTRRARRRSALPASSSFSPTRSATPRSIPSQRYSTLRNCSRRTGNKHKRTTRLNASTTRTLRPKSESLFSLETRLNSTGSIAASATRTQCARRTLTYSGLRLSKLS